MPEENLVQFVIQEANKAKIPPAMALSVIQVESGFNATARSKAGAYGYMQLMPNTAKGLKINSNNPRQNIVGGIRYLKQLSDTFEGDPIKTLAAYNAGPEAVKTAGGVPNFEETQNYLQKINAVLPEFQKLVKDQEQRFLPTFLKKPPEPTTKQTVQKFIPPEGSLEMAGMVAGSLGGATLGGLAGGIGAIPGGIAGAGLGAAGGRNLEIILKKFLDIIPTPPENVWKEITQSFVSGASAEMAGLGLGAVLGKAIGLFGKARKGYRASVKPEFKEIAETATQAEIPLTAGEMTFNKAFDVAETVFKKFPGAAGEMEKFGLRQKAAVQVFADHIQGAGKSVLPTSAGEAFVAIRNSAWEAWKAKKDVLYDAVSVKGKYRATETLKFLKEEIQKATRVGKGFIGTGTIKKMKDIFKTVNKPHTFSTLKEMREISYANSLQTGLTKTPVEAFYARLAGIITKDMEALAKNSGTGSFSTYQKANKFYKEGIEFFEKRVPEVIRKGGLEKPEKLIDQIFIKQGIQSVKDYKKLITQPADLAVFQYGVLNKIFREASNESGEILGNKLLQVLVGRQGYGREVLVEALGGKITNDLIKLGKISSMAKLATQLEKSGGPASIRDLLFFTGALGAVAGFTGATKGDTPLERVGITAGLMLASILGAKGLAKIYLSDKARNLFLHSVGLKKGIAATLGGVSKPFFLQEAKEEQ